MLSKDDDARRYVRIHSNDLVNRVRGRDPGIAVNIDIGPLPILHITLLGGNKGTGTTTTPPPANTPATSPPTNTPQVTPTQAPPQPAVTQAAPQAPSPIPAPSPNPAPSSGSGSNNGNSNNGGTDTGGGDSGNQPAPASTPPQGGSTGGSQSSPSSPAGAEQDSSTGSDPAGPPSSPGSGSTLPVQGSTGSTGGASNGGSGSSNSTSINLGSSFQAGESSSDTSDSASSGSPIQVVNAAVGTPQSAEGGQSGAAASDAGSGTSTIKGGSTVVGTGASPSTTGGGGTIGDPNSTQHGVSKAGGIAIAIVFGIFLIIGLVFVLRRHRKARQNQRSQVWWFTKKRTSQLYNDEKDLIVPLPLPPNGTHSSRSSFATTYDRSAQFDLNFAANMPALPPVAELRRSRNDFAYPIASPASSTEADSRFSLGSLESRDSQFFIVNHRPSLDTHDEHRRPSTANPFEDPSQRFAFPKPPTENTTRTSGYSSSTSSRPVSEADESLETTETCITSPSAGQHALPPASADPFADPEAFATWSTSSHSSNTTNPFTDSTVSTSHEGPGDYVSVAVIRAFAARNPDEVTVGSGDQVNVLQVFDDGWALVDKVQPGPGVDTAQRGLVPLGCLRGY